MTRLAERRLIMNADDFGISPGVNAGIIEAHERGIVTSASLMVRWPDAVAAANLGREHPRLSLGLHVDIGEWAFTEGEWVRLYEVVSADDEAALREELNRQIGAFEQITGHVPTHLDAHQHAHATDPLRSLMLAAAERLGVPVRDLRGGIRYSGVFYGQGSKGAAFLDGITVDALTAALRALPHGVTEMCCHPSLAADMAGMYQHERLLELKTLCDARVRATIESEGIGLCSFSDLPHGDRGATSPVDADC
jgi:predicted glycoside hydrolase/deacetylase ChbG (UPF0249 family)